ncbi:MAG: hypothetical protein AAGA88_02565 [Pseudomonadota bacterium]
MARLIAGMVDQAGNRPDSVLFMCGMNAIRSPMAEGLTRFLFPGQIYTSSAGVHAGEPDGFAIAAMDELGIDLKTHTPHDLEDLHDLSFDLIVTLAPEAHHTALELTRTLACDVEYWPTEDPSLALGQREERLDAYRRVRDTLMTRLKQRFAWRSIPGG